MDSSILLWFLRMFYFISLSTFYLNILLPGPRELACPPPGAGAAAPRVALLDLETLYCSRDSAGGCLVVPCLALPFMLALGSLFF
jgi:hypothetical protein